MFYECSSLISLNLSNFNINNVINMSYMFFNCYSLYSLDLSNFNTNNVKYMNNILDGVNKDCNLICNNNIIRNIFNN